MELGHVDADQVLLGIEQELGERLAELGLADAGRPEEQERAVGAVGIGKPERERRIASETSRTASSWPTTRLCSASSMCSSLSRSPCIIFDTGMPVARETTSAISSAPTCVRRSCGFFASSLASLRVGLLQLRLELRQLAVLELAHLLPVALAPRLFHLQLDLVDLLLDVLRARDLRLLRLPDLVEVRVFALELA